jgi:hypothetical protein
MYNMINEQLNLGLMMNDQKTTLIAFIKKWFVN